MRSVNDKQANTSANTSPELKCKPKEFGERLRKARKKAGFTQHKFGEAVGVSENTVYGYEAGQIPKGQTLAQMAYLLGCSTDWLLLGDERVSARQKEAPHQADPSQFGVGGEAGSAGGISQNEHQGRDRERPKIGEMITQVVEILESGTVYSTALESNIIAFHDAVRMERRIQDIQDKTDQRLEEMEKRLQGLEGENRELKSAYNGITAKSKEIEAEKRDLEEELEDLKVKAGNLEHQNIRLEEELEFERGQRDNSPFEDTG